MPMSELLSVSELSVEFTTDRGVAQVLDRISLAIGHGEVVGLVGESGCGKTTLARTVLGVLPAGGGSGAARFTGEGATCSAWIPAWSTTRSAAARSPSSPRIRGAR